MDEKVLHKKITLSGRVQGVAFRKYAYQAAKKFKISGFVKNLDNGSVYLEAEGQKDQIEQLIKWCHQGSPFSKVEKVEVKDGDPHHYPNFEIIY